MDPKSIGVTLAVAFLVGVVAGIGLYIKIRPTEEQRLQARIDRTIKTELCRRIDSDLQSFKHTPTAFKRTALQRLLAESRATARTLLHDVPEGYPIRYSGRAEMLLSECPTKARQWVKITSAFPEFYETEKYLVGSETKESVSLEKILPGFAINTEARERRLALVIGNSAYESRPLKNPLNDARSVAQFLRTVGFDVIEVLDADTTTMRRAVDKFVGDYGKYEVGLMYYSGHGIEFRGRNYLLPTNSSIQNEEEIPRQGFDANEILENLSRRHGGTTIFIIDACRNAPVFSKYRAAKAGLDAMSAPSGAIVAFSAGPGQVAEDGNGPNSPYTLALLKAAQTPNKRIEDILKEASRAVSDQSEGRQTPWYNSSLVGDFYFATEVARR